jgi:hypothetical protein
MRARWLAPGLGYAAGLLGGWILNGVLAAPVRVAWRAWVSTNLANLRDHLVHALVLSAFVTGNDPLGWILLGAVGLGVTARVLGVWRAVLLVAVGHVIGTLVSEGILGYRIAMGSAPDSDRYLMDIGASYVVVCALVAGIAYGTWAGRVLCATGFLLVAPDLFGGLRRLDLAPVGHACAIAVALGLGWLLRRSAATARAPAQARAQPSARDATAAPAGTDDAGATPAAPAPT